MLEKLNKNYILKKNTHHESFLCSKSLNLRTSIEDKTPKTTRKYVLCVQLFRHISVVARHFSVDVCVLRPFQLQCSIFDVAGIGCFILELFWFYVAVNIFYSLI